MKDAHPSVFFDNAVVERSVGQKHLGIYLDEKLDFNAYIKEKINKTSRGIGSTRKLQRKLPRNALLIIYKSFVRPHLDCGDIVYDQPTNDSIGKKLESFYYNAALVIIGAIKGTSQGKLYKELGLESLKLRRKLRRLLTFYKIKTTGLLTHLFRLMSSSTHSLQTRILFNITTYRCRLEAIKSSSFRGPLQNGIV